MYGLEFEGWIVQVDQLNQRVAGRVVRADMRFELFQMALAVAREWFPSPMAKSKGASAFGRPYFSCKLQVQ